MKAAAVAGLLGILAVSVWLFTRRPAASPESASAAATGAPTAPVEPANPARASREKALSSCDKGEWRACLDGLDEAKGLDPAGDAAPRILEARTRASDSLRALEVAAAPSAALEVTPPGDDKDARAGALPRRPRASKAAVVEAVAAEPTAKPAATGKRDDFDVDLLEQRRNGPKRPLDPFDGTPEDSSKAPKK